MGFSFKVVQVTCNENDAYSCVCLFLSTRGWGFGGSCCIISSIIRYINEDKLEKDYVNCTEIWAARGLGC